MRSSALAIGAALLLLLSAACGGDDGSSGASGGGGDGAPDTSAEPVAGGELTVLNASEIASLDTNALNGSAGAGGPVLSAIYGALVTYDADEAVVKPWLAESLEPDPDFSAWTLELREGLLFSDGSPLDAAAVKANWDRSSQPENRSPAYTFLANGTYEVVDPTTLRITLKVPDAHWDAGLSRRGANYIMAPTSFPTGGAAADAPIGAGPFMVESWQRDTQLVLVRNPNYFDAPRPYLDRLTFRIVATEDQRIDTFGTGGADGFYTNQPGSLGRAQEHISDAVYHHVEVPDSQILMANLRRPPFDDERARQVLAYGIDREALVDTVGSGARPADSFTLDDTPWSTPKAAIPGYDAAKAQELVDSYVADKGGPLVIDMIASQTTNQEIAKFIQTSLSQLDGVEISLELLDSPTYITRVRQLDFSLVPWGLPWTDPDVSIAPFFLTEAIGNYSGYSNAAADAAMKSGATTKDQDERAELYATVFEHVARDLPVLPISHGTFGYVTTSDVHGMDVYEDGIPRWDGVWKG